MFHFCEFSVSDELSSMRVGTDAVLLGAWANLEGAGRILDIGTGCGILALMAAQRSQAFIEAIDIDRASVLQASENFGLSKWSERLSANTIALQEWVKSTKNYYDHILSNPPFFTRSLKSPDSQRNITRHNDVLPVNELLSCTFQLLGDKGRASFVLPAADRERWESEGRKYGLSLSRACSIHPKAGKPASRILLEFTKAGTGSMENESMNIMDQKGNYTAEYKHITGEFYLGLP